MVEGGGREGERKEGREGGREGGEKGRETFSWQMPTLNEA